MCGVTGLGVELAHLPISDGVRRRAGTVHQVPDYRPQRRRAAATMATAMAATAAERAVLVRRGRWVAGGRDGRV